MTTSQPQSEVKWVTHGLQDVQSEPPGVISVCWDAATRFALLTLLFSTWLSTPVAIGCGAACAFALHLSIARLRNQPNSILNSLPGSQLWPVSTTAATGFIQKAIEISQERDMEPPADAHARVYSWNILDRNHADKTIFEICESQGESATTTQKLQVTIQLSREGTDTKAELVYAIICPDNQEAVLRSGFISRLATFHYTLCGLLGVDLPETNGPIFRLMMAYHATNLFMMKLLKLEHLSAGWALFGVLYTSIVVPAIISDFVNNMPMWYICATDITAALLVPGIFMYAIQIKSIQTIRLWFFLMPFFIIGEVVNLVWEMTHISTYGGELDQAPLSVILNIILLELMIPLPAIYANLRLGMRARDIKK